MNKLPAEHQSTELPETEVSTPPVLAISSDDEVAMLVAVLPERLREAIGSIEPPEPDNALIEIVMDLGRPPELRGAAGPIALVLGAAPDHGEVTQDEIDQVVARIGDFGKDNRAGIARTLHRISAIRNRKGRIIGLTLRVGRAVFGTVEIIRDIATSGQSILLLGAPGIGKTTMLREMARLLAQSKRVVIVDTSNEIAGDGDIPHPAIGHARRMQVATPDEQHEVMIEAVENHNPEVIVIDEIGRELETQAARTIAERGVQLIGTAHGRTLDNLMLNPTLSDLVGGIESVTLSDEEARRRGTQKSVLERRSPPTFDVVIELQGRQDLMVHHDTAVAIDALLRGRPLRPEHRHRDESGQAKIERGDVSLRERAAKDAGGSGSAPHQASAGSSKSAGSWTGGRGRRGAQGERADQGLLERELADRPAAANKRIKLYAYGVSQNRLRRSSRALGVPVELVDAPGEADALITLKSYYRKRPAAISEAEAARTPIYVLRSNTYSQIEGALIDLFGMHSPDQRVERALEEARRAIHEIRGGRRNKIELSPQSSKIRRQQHELVRSANLRSMSSGNDPNRRVRIYRS